MLKPPPDTHPDAALLAMKHELEEALMLADTLTRAWDEATTDQGGRQIERQADVTLERIARRQQEIAATPARTIAGTARPAPNATAGRGQGATKQSARVRQRPSSSLSIRLPIARHPTPGPQIPIA